jgi:hyaluronan synthase
MLHPATRYVLTGDDDTVWHPDATRHLVAALQRDRVGATTGHVATLNPRDTWLTRVTAIRYWVAFQIERAAQSYYGAVTCVSGPLGGYRRYLIDQIGDDFVNQRFLRRPCTFGDDRHLTNLVLARGYQVTYSRAQAWTEVPGRMRKYLKQQKRWGKSHWREMIWTAKALPLHSPMLAADWALTLLLPFLLVASMAWYAWSAVTDSPLYLAGFAAMVVAMSIVRAVPAVVATRDPSFLWWMPFFSVFHLFVLLPLKFVSLVTVADGSWGTRAIGAPAQRVFELHEAATEEFARIPVQRTPEATDVR